MPINTNTKDRGHTKIQARENEKDLGEVNSKGGISSFRGEEPGLDIAQRKDCDTIVTINPLIPVHRDNENKEPYMTSILPEND